MRLGGLGARRAVSQERKSHCKRCGWYYDSQKHTLCPGCSTLNDGQLQELFAQRVRTQERQRILGFGFFIAALISAVLVYQFY